MSIPKLIHLRSKSEHLIKDGQMFKVGRNLDNDFVCEDIEISRHHCNVKNINGKCILTDSSGNGTRVNSVLYRKNDSVELKNGDIIDIVLKDLSFIFKNTPDSAENNTIEVADSSVEDLDTEPAACELDTESARSSVTAIEQPVGEEVKVKSENLDIMEKELTCSICSELFIKAVTLSCAHTFCKFCIDQWTNCNKQTCPICRKTITTKAPTLVLDNFIDKILESQSEEMKQVRRELVEQREQSIKSVAGSSAAALTSSAPVASTSSGVNSSVIEIMSGDDEDYDEDDYDGYDSYNFDDYSDYDDYSNDEDYNGLPGHYYGGYGSCYTCGQRGHWSNGCPVKRRRT